MDTPASLTSKRIGCIGCGNMGGAILGGLAEVPGLELYGYNRTPQRLEPLCAKGVTAVPDIPGIAARCDILVIGVKPYLVGGVLAEALPSLKPETVIISIAAGVTLHDLRDAVQGHCHVVRVMPNTPALVGAGVFGIQEDPALPKDVFAMILDLFGLLGSTIVLPEKKFNAFMALVGCGPAYVFHFMDALAEAGVTMGFTRQEALELVTQLVLGSAKLAALPGSHPAILREQVCSPAGVTIAAVNHLDRTAVRGHRLLKDKRDELMRQFFLIVRENKALRAKVEAGIEEANRAMTVASSVMSPEMLQQALLYPKQSATLDMTFKNIMSVSVPIYEFHTKSEDAASIYPYGFAQTSGELDDALGALASVFQDMLELAQAEKKTQLLASEIEKTRRRVNALEYVMIPEMEKNIKYISMKLEENDRATKVRLMKVKDMVLKDAHEFED